MIDFKYALHLWPHRAGEQGRSPLMQTLSIVWFICTFMGMLNSVALVAALIYYTGHPAVVGALCV
jgi:hypothetical protein